MLWGTCHSKLHYVFNSNPSTLFLYSLSGCPIAAAEKLAMSQDKSQLDSPQTGQCSGQVHRYDLPMMSLILYSRPCSYTMALSPIMCQFTMAWPSFSATDIHLRGWLSWSYYTLKKLLDPPEVSFEINMYAKVAKSRWI